MIAGYLSTRITSQRTTRSFVKLVPTAIFGKLSFHAHSLEANARGLCGVVELLALVRVDHDYLTTSIHRLDRAIEPGTMDLEKPY